MPAERPRRIRRRLLLGTTGLAVALSGLALAAVVRTTELVLRRQVDDQLERELLELRGRHAERGWQELAAELGRRGGSLRPFVYVFTEAPK